MHVLEMLGAALGLASLAGINLYLTVLVTGLAVRFHWIQLSAGLESLAVLADPVIIGIAGFLYFAEFFADKVPWVDSMWDAIHTFMRPIGAALLAILALGTPHPVFDVAVALLGAGMGLATHLTKAGTRLLVNGSPEPVSNVVVSLAEDGLVVAGLLLVSNHPLIALGVFLVLFAMLLWALPRFWVFLHMRSWLGWQKFQVPARPGSELSSHLPSELRETLSEYSKGNVLWACSAILEKGAAAPPHSRCWVVAVDSDADKVWVLVKSRFGNSATPIDLNDSRVELRPRFLFDEVNVTSADSKKLLRLIFEKPRSAIAAKLVECIDKLRPKDAPLALDYAGSSAPRAD